MPSATIVPYVFFGGKCEEALTFYQSALGAEIEMVMRFDESPDAPPPGVLKPGFEKKVMHCSFRVQGAQVMASDGSGDSIILSGFRLSLAFETEADAKQAFARLAEGGTVQMPITRTFWSPCFGMVTDRFGLGWMVTVTMPGQ